MINYELWKSFSHGWT